MCGFNCVMEKFRPRFGLIKSQRLATWNSVLEKGRCFQERTIRTVYNRKPAVKAVKSPADAPRSGRRLQN